MLLKEKYKRPCFVVCSKCEKHGVIIFEDGSQSTSISSIDGGKKVLKDLVSSGKLSEDDAQKIEDQLVCSDLMNTEEEALILGILSLLCTAIKEVNEERMRSN